MDEKQEITKSVLIHFDGIYKHYMIKTHGISIESPIPYQDLYLYGTLTGMMDKPKFRQYTKEEFIHKVWENEMFSKKWYF